MANYSQENLNDNCPVLEHCYMYLFSHSMRFLLASSM